MEDEVFYNIWGEVWVEGRFFIEGIIKVSYYNGFDVFILIKV